MINKKCKIKNKSKFFIRFFYLVVIYIFCFVKVSSVPFKDSIYKENIKTVLLYGNDDKLSEPVIYLDYNEKLTLSFDELKNEAGFYYYTFIHCGPDWMPTDIPHFDYIEGFVYEQINDYEYSFSTNIGYIHYKIEFPNDQISLKLSGNYIIKVYEGFNEEKVVLTKRFSVIDEKVEIVAKVRKPIVANQMEEGQEISFKVNTGSYLINDPYNDLTAIIKQNSRQDNYIVLKKPLFIRSGELSYEYHDENIFQGGSEFRYFNIKSMRYISEHINKIDFIYPYYYVDLYYDKARTFERYFYNPEINGKYFIDVQEQENDETDADYVKVNFTLPFDAPMIDGEIYILGALTNWSFNAGNKMEYDFETKTYKKTLLLKQGYYNYLYAFVEKYSTIGDLSLVEGSHHQTENNYEIFIYQRRPGNRYTELIGYRKINSMKDVE